MNSKLPPFRPPSPFIPFLRRFTDEIELEREETIALYNSVHQNHLKSVWSASDIVERISNQIAEITGQLLGIPQYLPLAQALDRCLREIVALETTVVSFPEIEWNRALLSMTEAVDLRRFLRAKQHFLANEDRVFEQLQTALGNIMGGIIQNLPPIPENPTTSFTVPLFEMMKAPAELVSGITGVLMADELLQSGLFAELQNRLYVNVCEASGIVPYADTKRPLVTADKSDLPPNELVEAYLKGTPFLELLRVAIPFAIPERTRFEHTHIIGGSGHGKTTLIIDQILSDLAKPEPPALVVIDPKGVMVRQLQQLAVFDGRLKDCLIVINPEDVNHPPALNMFHSVTKRSRMYSDEVRRQIENNTVSLFHYIFGSIASALTQKQATAFSFIVRLLFDIPNATIHTLLELVEEDAKTAQQSRFNAFIQRQPTTARRFFEHHFYHPTEFRETKQQIAHRLYGILQYPEFDAMFSTPERKLDMFDALQSRSVVLVNAAKPLLGKEASQLFGRYMIALTLSAAFERIGLDKNQWTPAFLVIDEAQEFVDDEKTQELMQQAREFNLGVTVAHQQIEGQLSLALRSTFAANTSIKFAGGVSATDASMMAKDMRCEPQFIQAQRKGLEKTHFAAYVRGYTEHPVSIELDLGGIEKQPKMLPSAYEAFTARNRARLAATPALAPIARPGEPSSIAAPEQPPRPQPAPDTPEAGSTW